MTVRRPIHDDSQVFALHKQPSGDYFVRHADIKINLITTLYRIIMVLGIKNYSQ